MSAPGPVGYMLIPLQPAGDRLICMATGQPLSFGANPPPRYEVVAAEVIDLLRTNREGELRSIVNAGELARLRQCDLALKRIVRQIDWLAALKRPITHADWTTLINTVAHERHVIPKGSTP